MARASGPLMGILPPVRASGPSTLASSLPPPRFAGVRPAMASCRLSAAVRAAVPRPRRFRLHSTPPESPMLPCCRPSPAPPPHYPARRPTPPSVRVVVPAGPASFTRSTCPVLPLADPCFPCLADVLLRPCWDRRLRLPCLDQFRLAATESKKPTRQDSSGFRPNLTPDYHC